MKVFLDANVILDYLTDRQPFADDAEAVVDFCVLTSKLPSSWRKLSDGVLKPS